MPRLMPLSSTTEHSLSSVVRKVQEDSRMPVDEPVWQIMQAVAARLDRLESIQAGFGPDAGQEAAKQAAFAANQTVASYMQRVAWRLGILQTAGIVGLCAIAALASWVIRGQLLQDTPMGPMPIEMAKVLPHQDWQAQYDACRPQPSLNGYEWCLMPFVRRVPDSPAVVTKR